MNRHYFLAFDIGATSGRSILAILQDGKLELKELTRFPNRIIRIHNKYYWNIYSLFEELKKGIRAALSQGIPVESAGIDTWGVDFVYIAEDGTFTGLPRAYRDPYTDNIPEDYFTAVFPEKEVYGLTGIQIMNINSLFQLYAAKKENSQALLNAKKLLFIPDALSYLLTGKKICEYTIASTSQLLNPRTKQFETKLLEKAGIPGDILLPEITPPGSIIGNLSESIREECPAGEIPVIAVAGHDTASAVAAVPAENERFAYLSSGTWSLMGIEVKNPIINEQTARMNFTNEGGVDGTTRLLKNITGMWLLEQCRKEWELQGTAYTYAEIVDLSATVDGFQSLIDPENAVFSNPPSMTEAIAGYCKASGQKIPETHAGFIRCIFDSLALKYKQVLNDLRELSPFEIEKLHIIGGGSQNKLLNRLTANATGIPVIAGPSEATAIGNALLQAKGLGIVESL
ncbi:MAG: rhamnulokinase, partial [Candidatus Symbiothrix sp.]|nr:rhamnulokinase [Candidatus Symbiothrix sp.]